MPFIRSESGIRIHYRLDGRPGLPLLVLGNSLGTDLFMWDRQIEPLTRHLRVLRWDVRGHGASDLVEGDASMGDFGRDLLALADELGIDQFSYCGLSLGAMIGQWLALHAPARLDRLVLASAAAHLPSHDSWSQRMALVRSAGMPGLLDMVMPRFFSEAYRQRDEPFYHSMRTTFATTPAEGYAAACAAVRDADFRDQLAGIRIPTLVIGGALDTATPPAIHAHELVAGIPGAASVTLEAGHIANVEQPHAFNQTVLQFCGTPL